MMKTTVMAMEVVVIDTSDDGDNGDHGGGCNS